jgi:hypothetical protein
MKKILLLTSFIGILLLATGCCYGDDKLCNAKQSYDRAVERCGVDNIDSHKYDNGSKDYDCLDYSKCN